jgi:hypothetical protein
MLMGTQTAGDRSRHTAHRHLHWLTERRQSVPRAGGDGSSTAAQAHRRLGGQQSIRSSHGRAGRPASDVQGAERTVGPQLMVSRVNLAGDGPVWERAFFP